MLELILATHERDQFSSKFNLVFGNLCCNKLNLAYYRLAAHIQFLNEPVMDRVFTRTIIHSLYFPLIIGQNHSGMISYLDDDVVWIVLGTDQDRLNLLLQTCQEGFKLVQSSKNLKKSYEPKIGEICYFKDNEESQLVR